MVSLSELIGGGGEFSRSTQRVRKKLVDAAPESPLISRTRIGTNTVGWRWRRLEDCGYWKKARASLPLLHFVLPGFGLTIFCCLVPGVALSASDFKSTTRIIDKDRSYIVFAHAEPP